LIITGLQKITTLQLIQPFEGIGVVVEDTSIIAADFICNRLFKPRKICLSVILAELP
jgi:hypothetical protein